MRGPGVRALGAIEHASGESGTRGASAVLAVESHGGLLVGEAREAPGQRDDPWVAVLQTQVRVACPTPRLHVLPIVRP